MCSPPRPLCRLAPLGLLLLLACPAAVGAWRSHCKPEPGPDPTPPEVDVVNCTAPTTRIESCYCKKYDPEIPAQCANETAEELADAPEWATGTTIFEVSVILQKLGQKKEAMDEGSWQSVWLIFDRLLNINQRHFLASNDIHFEELSGSTQRLLTSLDTLLRKRRLDATFLGGANLGLIQRRTWERCPQMGEEGIGLADFGSHFGELGTSRDTGTELVSIEVPKRAICADGSRQKRADFVASLNVQSDQDVYFVVYRKAHFFLGNTSHPGRPSLSDRQTRCQPRYFFASPDGIVLTATVGQKLNGGGGKDNANGTMTMARVRYQKKLAPTPLHGRHVFSWWSQPEADWSHSGLCSLSSSGDYLQAECAHLTDFTLLVDGLATDPSLCDVFLMDLGFALTLSSFLALVILNAIYVVHKWPSLHRRVFADLFRNRLPKMHLDEQALFYNVTLMLFFLLFAVFSDQAHLGGSEFACRAVALVNYWLLMACVMLTIFQAWRILKVFLWTVALERMMIVATKKRVALTVSYGVPALLCLLFGLTLDDFFYRDDEFCWIRPNYVWFSVVLPLTILVANAILCSVIISIRLFPNSFGARTVLRGHATASIRLSKGARKEGRNKMAVLFLIQFSLGMPWILQFATIGISGVSFIHFLFTLVNGSQGLILLSLFGYKQLQSWRTERQRSTRDTERAADADLEKTGSRTEESKNVFTNSIGMRIPVRGPSAEEGDLQD